jgi:hypothetical protein
MKSIISVSSSGFMCRATSPGPGEHLGVIDGHLDIEAAEIRAVDRSVMRAAFEKKLPAVSSQESSR